MKRSRNRLLLVTLMLLMGFAVIIFRITMLSFKEDKSETVRASGNVRGPILDRRGLTLALTEEASSIGLAPKEILDAEFTAAQLSPLLGMSNHDILEKIYFNKERKYFLLKRQVDNLSAFRIMELNLPGVHRESEFQRIYPNEKLAGNLLGFVGRDPRESLAGVEHDYHDLLTSSKRTSLRRGPSLYLTIDSLIQHRMERAMEPVFIRSKAKRASGILMDVHTGEVLAMANFPNFDPNRYWESKPFDRGNWAIRFNYEPGSTVKIIMAAILLSEGAVRLGETFDCDGEFRKGDLVIRDKRGTQTIRYGHLKLSEIIRYSSNVGIIKAMQRVNKDRLHYYLTTLGLGAKTDILPPGSGETAGYLPDLKSWVPSNSYYYPIGQGFSVTPIQLLRASAAIANGGKLVKPRLLSRVVDSDGRLIEKSEQFEAPAPFNPQVLPQVLKMMQGSVTDGTGKAAKSTHISIAGKTGTAQKSSARGYTEKYVASFIGFFPADKPKYGALIIFDEAGDHESGGSIAAPVFKEIVEGILPLLQEGAKPLHVEETLPPLKKHLPKDVSANRMADLKGVSARRAVELNAKYWGLKIELHGSGYVYHQSPAPNSPLKGDETLILYLEDLE